MAEVSQAVFTRLSTYSGLTALIGTRVYPSLAPQNPKTPYVTFQQIAGGVPTSVMGADNALTPTLFQIDAWGTSYLVAHQVATQAQAALQRYSGTPSGSGIEIHQGFIERLPTDIYEDDIAQADDVSKRLHRVSMDVRIWWRPS